MEFSICVREAELVRAAGPTPQEIKYLSNIDDQMSLRHHIPFVHFFAPKPGSTTKDPCGLIKMALSRTLMYYYPLSGRLRSSSSSGNEGKLVVDCCDEGVMFREADADITLEKLMMVEGGLKPPFPQWERLLVDDLWGNDLIIDSPLLRIQVTRLSCGGFVLAYTLNHCACDTNGALQFIKTIAEFCCDPHRKAPSIVPSWGREILKPRSPPIISFRHLEYNLNDLADHETQAKSDLKNLVQTSVFLSNDDILALKRQVTDRKCVSFDVIASCLWRARTRTLFKTIYNNDMSCTMRLLFPIDTRFQFKPDLPKGFYGSTMVVPSVITTGSELLEKPLCHAVSLISKAKSEVVRDEYRASVVDFLDVNKGGEFWDEMFVTDMRWFKFAEVDFGWGKGVYAGPARAGVGPVPWTVTSMFYHKNVNGAEGVLALISLPSSLVKKFHNEVRREIRGFSAL
ncbi:hypothetical protein Sjap_024841 [Stephania japonica]|uniref:Uncharacterized protein n=1 Tax=Stephania japonica TaxID=461633 RepID=A0AAP0HLW6_9MAGN